MPAVVPIALGLSAAATVYGASQQKRAADQAAQVDTAAADYNARLDRAQEKQIDLDTVQNIRTERQNAAMLLSRQAASYAASGVLATTGSPMHVQVTNAGRLEQRIQQQWQDAQFRMQTLESQARMGIAAGAAQAASDRMRGTIALIDGGAKLAGMAFRAYQGGMFGGTSGGSSAAVSPSGYPSGGRDPFGGD